MAISRQVFYAGTSQELPSTNTNIELQMTSTEFKEALNCLNWRQADFLQKDSKRQHPLDAIDHENASASCNGNAVADNVNVLA